MHSKQADQSRGSDTQEELCRLDDVDIHREDAKH